jgi:hypothetical protein
VRRADECAVRRSSAVQLVEQRICALQVSGVETFGEPAVDVAEQLPRRGVFALALSEFGEAGGGAQFE